jgi:hypothetical protein
MPPICYKLVVLAPIFIIARLASYLTIFAKGWPPTNFDETNTHVDSDSHGTSTCFVTSTVTDHMAHQHMWQDTVLWHANHYPHVC